MTTEERPTWSEYASGEWSAFMGELDDEERERVDEWLDDAAGRCVRGVLHPRDVDYVIAEARRALAEEERDR